MRISIQCPQCMGEGQIKKLENIPCTYCKEEKQILLENHLKVLNEPEKIERVLNFQKRYTRMMKNKTKK